MANNKDMEKKYGLMVLFTRVNIKMGKSMEKEKFHVQMGEFMMENGSRILFMDRDNKYELKEKDMLVIGLMVSLEVLVFINLKMEIIMKESGLTVKNMAKVFIFILMVEHITVCEVEIK